MRFGLKIKFTLFTSLLILVLGVVSSVYFAVQTKMMLEDELKKLGSSFVVQFAMDEEVRSALYLEQTAFLDTPLNRLRELDVEDELAYCRVLMPNGEVFREERDGSVAIDLDNVLNIDDLSSVREPKVSRFVVRPLENVNEIVYSDTFRSKRLKEIFYDFLAPVFDKKGIAEEEFARILSRGDTFVASEDVPDILGYVQVGLSSAQINSKLWKILLKGIVPLSLITILGGFWVLYFIAKRIANPLSKLVGMTSRVAKGDLEHKVYVKTGDEIGVLAESFNHMIIDLKKQRDDKEHVMMELRDVNKELAKSNNALIKTNDQLKDAQEQIIRSEKLAAAGQLASSIAHELRTPIGAIKNSIYFIKRKIVREQMHDADSFVKLIDIVNNEAERSAKIITNLLGFTQTSKPSVAPNSVKHVIEETLLRVKTPESIRIINDVNDDLPKVLIDSLQVGQVFLNIIQNSYQAMPGGGSLRISTSQSDKFVNVKFEDSGVGISGKLINKIFDPLFTTKAGGIGLGLAFSSNVIKRHGGDITVRSVEGKGTVFTVSLLMVI